jgi:hypothetical protein
MIELSPQLSEPFQLFLGHCSSRCLPLQLAAGYGVSSSAKSPAARRRTGP